MNWNLRKTLMPWLGSALTAVTLLAAGCADDHGDPLAEACGHFTAQGGVARTLGADATSAVDLPAAHERIDLTFVEAEFDSGSKGLGGHGAVAIDAAGDWAVLISEDTPVEVRGPNGAVLAPESTQTAPAACPAAVKVLTFELAVGKHAVRIGPSTASGAKLLIERLEHDEDAH
ncbi:MAG: hypothetical protein RIT45_1806 [Pseudomonadota bacterium]|jgi:hypothetical protein